MSHAAQPIAARRALLVIAFALGACTVRFEPGPTAGGAAGANQGGSGAVPATGGNGGSGAEPSAGGSGGTIAEGGAGGGVTGGGGGAGGSGGGSGGDPIEDAGALDAAPDAEAIDASEANNDCLDGIVGFMHEGPFAFEVELVGNVRMWRPSVPSGCKVPVVSFANGTGATCATYGETFDQLASHGFLVACYETGNTGNGEPCETAIATALEHYPELADKRIGIAGHVQGGGSAFMCVARAEARWPDAFAIAGHFSQPEHGFGGTPGWMDVYPTIVSPMFMFHGTEAGSHSNVGDGFAQLSTTIEAYWYAAVGAEYIPVPQAWMGQSAVAWFRWKLLGDGGACWYLRYSMLNSEAWDEFDVKNPVECGAAPPGTD